MKTAKPNEVGQTEKSVEKSLPNDLNNRKAKTQSFKKDEEKYISIEIISKTKAC